jgi:hypothetical protein
MDRKENLNQWLADTRKEMLAGDAASARGNVEMLLQRFHEANGGKSINQTLASCYALGIEVQPLY